MDISAEVVIVVVLLSAFFITIVVVKYLRDKVITNKVFKPIQVQEAEDMVQSLIKKRYGRRKKYLEEFLNDFILEFPEWQSHTRKHLKMCLNPNEIRKNANLLEDVLRFFEKTYIVEGSINHASM